MPPYQHTLSILSQKLPDRTPALTPPLSPELSSIQASRPETTAPHLLPHEAAPTAFQNPTNCLQIQIPSSCFLFLTISGITGRSPKRVKQLRPDHSFCWSLRAWVTSVWPSPPAHHHKQRGPRGLGAPDREIFQQKAHNASRLVPCQPGSAWNGSQEATERGSHLPDSWAWNRLISRASSCAIDGEGPGDIWAEPHKAAICPHYSHLPIGYQALEEQWGGGNSGAWQPRSPEHRTRRQPSPSSKSAFSLLLGSQGPEDARSDWLM